MHESAPVLSHRSRFLPGGTGAGHWGRGDQTELKGQCYARCPKAELVVALVDEDGNPAQQLLICREFTHFFTTGWSIELTRTTSLAVAAVQAGEKVIAFDLDPQGTLTAWAHIRQQPAPSIAQLPARESGRLAEVLAAAK
jgi:hypothetical protein